MALGTKALQALQATCDELGVELPPERDESVVMEEESAISPPPSASLEFCASDDANASAAVESPRHEPDTIPNSEGDAELLLLNDRIETTTIASLESAPCAAPMSHDDEDQQDPKGEEPATPAPRELAADTGDEATEPKARSS